MQFVLCIFTTYYIYTVHLTVYLEELNFYVFVASYTLKTFSIICAINMILALVAFTITF